jgi:DNA-binding NtrC family response regulator
MVTVRDCMRLVFDWTFRDYELAQCDTGHGTLREVARQTPDLLITDCCHVGLSFPETLPILYRMQVRFPIIVASAQIGGPEIRDRLLSFPGLDINLLSKPFTVAELRNAVLQFLGPNPRKTQHLISLARPNRTARIVLLDDDSAARDLVRTMLPLWFRDYLLIECTTGDEAWREITRHTPDLLITDYGHTGYSFEELLHRFYRSRSKFPILLSSLYVGACPELQQRLLFFPGYSITPLNKPFRPEALKFQVLKALPHVNPSGN